MHVCMLAFSDLNYDYRVFREASALRSRGHQVTIVALEGHDVLHSAWDEFEVHVMQNSPGQSLRVAYPKFWWRARGILRDLKADVYHAHDLDALLPSAQIAQRLDKLLVYDSHELWIEQSSLVHRPRIRRFWQHLETRLIGQATHVITVSDPIAATLQERYELNDVTVLRNLPPYREPVTADRIRECLNLPPEAVILLYQGGFLTDNGLFEQIDAMVSVRDAHLVLLGGGPTESALRERVVTEKVKDRVHFLPRVPFSELHTYTCSADLGMCLIKPTGRSFYWSLPNKLFEYLMAGLPVLASDAPQIAALVRTSGVGECVDAASVEAISEHLERLVGNPKIRAKYAMAARASARHFCWEREQQKLLAVYENLTA